MFPTEKGIGIGAAADFNGDGADDLVLDRSEGVSIYFGDDGLFGGPRLLLPGTAAAAALDVVDFDGDGSSDVVVDIESLIRVFLNDGAGSFVEAHTLVATGDAFAVESADVDLDGDIDIMEGHYDAPPTLYRNQGGGVFDVEHPVPVAGSINLFEVADFDGDGSVDVLMASPGTCGSFGCSLGSTFIYANDGTGQFAPAPFSSPHIGFVLEAALGDLDGDGFLDVVVAGASVDGGSFALENDGTGHLEAVEGLFGATVDGRRVAVTDLSFDGDLDIYFETLDGGRLYEHQATAFDYVEVTDRLPSRCCLGSGFGGDFDGDGFGDFFFAGGPALLLSDADGHLQAATGSEPATLPSVNELVLVDVNGDALPDAFQRSFDSVDVLLGGEGGFVWSESIALGGYAPGTRLLLPADIENDGDTDLLSLRQTQEDDLLRHDVDSFTDVSAEQLPSQPNNSLGGVFFDLEGDGDGDFAIVATAPLTTRLLINDGAGTFALAPSSQLPLGPPADGVVALDADLDGDLDLLSSGGVLRHNDGTGAFPLPAASVGASGTPATGDFDGDGDPDILMDERVLWNNGGTFSLADSLTLGGSGGMSVVDIDGDGDPDVLSGSGMLFENVDGGFRPKKLTEEHQGNRIPSAADFDGDQDVDVIFPGGILLNGVSQHTAWRRLARTGRELAIDVYGDPGEPFVLMWALGTFELAIPGFGALLLDPSSLTVAAVGRSNPKGYASFAATVPAVSSLAGVAVRWQSLVGTPARLTNRETTVIGAGG